MDESIYNLVPVEYVVPTKPPMHRSTKKPEVTVQNSTFGKLLLIIRIFD